MYSGTNLLVNESEDINSTQNVVEHSDLSLLSNAIKNINQATESDALINKILIYATKITKADYAGFIKVNPDALLLSAIQEKGKYIPISHNSSKIMHALVPESIIKHSLRFKRKLILNQLTTQQSFSDDCYLIAKSPLSILCYPITYSNEVVGIIYLENNNLLTSYSEYQIELLDILTSVASSAIKSLNNKVINQLKEERKDREISAKALEIYHKNQVLIDIRNNVEEIFPLSDTKLKNALSKIVKSVKSVIHDKQHWEHFRNYFENVHPYFFDTIQRIYPQLSLEDLKYCAFIKLHMSNREIAHLLNINQESVRTHKYRIKKKIKLTKEQDLHEHLSEIYSNAKLI